MPTKEVSMRKIRELLRLHFTAGLSQHQIATSLNLSVGVVNKYVRLALQAKLGWPLPVELEDDIALKRALVPMKEAALSSPPLDFSALHLALKQKGVTLQLLWEEYCPTVEKAVQLCPLLLVVPHVAQYATIQYAANSYSR